MAGRAHVNDLGQVTIGDSAYPLDIVAVRPETYQDVVFVRPNTSDIPVFQAVFHQKGYEGGVADEGAEIIVDLGANIGLSSAYFHEKFEKARIFALEPSKSNFDILALNAMSRPRITPIYAAIWDRDGVINLDELSEAGDDLGHWGHRTTSAPVTRGRTVQALSMGTLMERHGIHEIDVLKVDIEGAEFELFNADDKSWLKRVKSIVVETHERFRPGVDAVVTEATRGIFVEQGASGECRVFTRT